MNIIYFVKKKTMDTYSSQQNLRDITMFIEKITDNKWYYNR